MLRSCALVLLLVVALVQAVPQATSGVPDYQYNITVVLPPSDNRNQEGKLWVILEGKNNGEPFQHEVSDRQLHRQQPATNKVRRSS